LLLIQLVKHFIFDFLLVYAALLLHIFKHIYFNFGWIAFCFSFCYTFEKL